MGEVWLTATMGFRFQVSQSSRRQLEFAIRKRIQKVVFIHGVGAGVLKEELNYLFKRYENVKYYDIKFYYLN